MIVLNRSAAKIEHTVVSTICNYFRLGDLLVLNDSYMLSNTVYGHEPDGTKSNLNRCRSSQGPGLTLTSTNDDRLTCSLLEPQPDRIWKARFEPFEVGDKATAQINRAQAEGRRVITVGTTVMRTLESLAANKEPNAAVQAQAAWDRSLYLPWIQLQGCGCAANEPPPAAVQPYCAYGSLRGEGFRYAQLRRDFREASV
jgi:hypothetical protein